MMPGTHEYVSQPLSPHVLPRWCSSSLNRPDSTRASYSAMGPWAFSGSAVESELIRTSPALACHVTYTPWRPAHTLGTRLGPIAQRWRGAALAHPLLVAAEHPPLVLFFCSPNTSFASAAVVSG